MRNVFLCATMLMIVQTVSAVTPLSRVHFSTDTPVLLDGNPRNANQIAIHNVGGAIEGAPILNELIGTDDIDALVDQGGGRYLFSLRYQKKLGTTLYNPADIIRWNGSGYELFLDSNSLGIPLDANVDAFALMSSNPFMLLSFDRPILLGSSLVTPSDLVVLQPSIGFFVGWDASASGVPETANLTAIYSLANENFLASFDQGFVLHGVYVKPGSMVEIDLVNSTAEISYDASTLFNLDSGVHIDAFSESLVVTGSINDGAFSFMMNPAQTRGNSDLSFSGGDQIFSNGWFYRSATDTQEKPLPSPDTVYYNGNNARYIWFNLDGKLSVSQNIDLNETQADQKGKLTVTMQVDSLDGQPVTYSFFHYVDLDVSGVANGNTASLFAASPPSILIEEGATKILYSGNASTSAYQVTAYESLLDILEDGLITNLNNSGLPFSGDFTGGMQWNMSGASLQATVTLEVNPTTVQAVDCSGVTFTDQTSGRTAMSGGQLTIDYLDAFIGGIGGDMSVVGSGLPATVEQVRIVNDAANQILAIPNASSFAVPFSTQGDSIPDDTVLTDHYSVYFGVADPVNAGQFIEGAACQLTTAWSAPEVTASISPAHPQSGDHVTMNVQLRNVKLQSPGGLNQFGVINSTSANWTGDKLLADLGAVSGINIVYDQVVNIASVNAGDQGAYTITAFGIAGSESQQIITIDFGLLFKDSFE